MSKSDESKLSVNELEQDTSTEENVEKVAARNIPKADSPNKDGGPTSTQPNYGKSSNGLTIKTENGNSVSQPLVDSTSMTKDNLSVRVQSEGVKEATSNDEKGGKSEEVRGPHGISYSKYSSVTPLAYSDSGVPQRSIYLAFHTEQVSFSFSLQNLASLIFSNFIGGDGLCHRCSICA